MLSGETESGRGGAWVDPWHSSSVISMASEAGEEVEPRVCDKLEGWNPFFPRGVAGFSVCEAGAHGTPFPRFSFPSWETPGFLDRDLSELESRPVLWSPG